MCVSNDSSPWQEEEDQAAPAPPCSRQAQDYRPDPSVPRYHRIRRRQGRPPRQDLSPRRRYYCSEEAFGKQTP